MDAGQDETQLLQAGQKGDEVAFGRLIQPCMDPAYRLTLRLLGRREEAEDAVQGRSSGPGGACPDSGGKRGS